ncbi:exported hypothetical protein [Candidatus Zixiibacteriota bacterium]|nr:exported hypothetical protein [candidate division Zixibacteria bacterium]
METNHQILNIASLVATSPVKGAAGSPTESAEAENNKSFNNIFGATLKDDSGKSAPDGLIALPVNAAMPLNLNIMDPISEENPGNGLTTQNLKCNQPVIYGELLSLLNKSGLIAGQDQLSLDPSGLLLNNQDLMAGPNSILPQDSNSINNLPVMQPTSSLTQYSPENLSLNMLQENIPDEQMLNNGASITAGESKKIEESGLSKNFRSDIIGKPAILRTTLDSQFAGLKPLDGLDEVAAGLNVRETYIYNEGGKTAIPQSPQMVNNSGAADLKVFPPLLDGAGVQPIPREGQKPQKDSPSNNNIQVASNIENAPTEVPISRTNENIDPKSHDSDKIKNPVDLQTGSIKTTGPNVALDKTSSPLPAPSQTSSATVETPAPAVRFIVPPELTKGNIKNGQVVVIKMEPENLGQLRLILSTHHDTINGRLIVENNAVRTVVESNLTNLYDQLSRQGIRLENFEVALNAGQNGRQFGSGRSSDDTKPSGRSRKYLPDNVSSIQSAPSVPRGRMYIGSAGVNWMA